MAGSDVSAATTAAVVKLVAAARAAREHAVADFSGFKVFKALSEGQRSFTRIAVVADTASPTPPCGACRQIIWEFCGDIEVVLANLSSVQGRLQMKALLPLPFDKSLLGR